MMSITIFYFDFFVLREIEQYEVGFCTAAADEFEIIMKCEPEVQYDMSIT